MSLKVITAKNAALLDQELMSTCGFSIDQLMELAGLSVAQSVYKAYPPTINNKNCLILCGPGNNGGDGLVAARHLKLFEYNVKVLLPKKTNKLIYDNLITQLKLFKVEFVPVENLYNELKICDLIIDALFGFSFKPPIRAPFDSIILEMLKYQNDFGKKVVAVDIPSGWDVNDGPILNEVKNYHPDLLVSLTAPKPCTLKLNKNSKHFVGGRFINDEIAEKWDIQVPNYKGSDQIYQLQ